MTEKFDAIIVGAGPVGLFLACELKLAGVSTLVLERDHEADSAWKNGSLGLRGLFPTSTEAFHRRGLLDRVNRHVETGLKFGGPSGQRFLGHFAGMMIDGSKVDFSRWKYFLQGPSARPKPTSIGNLETVFAQRAQELGVPILRGAQVSHLDDRGDHVEVRAGDREFSAQWLVGCDGGRSFVRKAAGFDFEGTEAEFIGYIALCDLDRRELLGTGFVRTQGGMYASPRPQHVLIMEKDPSFDRSQPITAAHFQQVLQRVSGTDIKVEALHMATTLTDRCKQVTQYRKGRVLLAGDSAHIHPPLGAQGLNTGIGDAMNLGWKLAATIKGRAAPGLLDTYHDERHPIGAGVLDWNRAQITTLRPDAHGRAIARITRQLIDTEDGASYFIEHIWGLNMRYNLHDPHPLVGHSVPEFEFQDGSRLASKMESGCFLVLDFGADAEAESYVKPLGPVVQYCGLSPTVDLGFKSLLVRPDGIVAWLSEDSTDVDSLKAALSRWVTLE